MSLTQPISTWAASCDLLYQYRMFNLVPVTFEGDELSRFIILFFSFLFILNSCSFYFFRFYFYSYSSCILLFILFFYCAFYLLFLLLFCLLYFPRICFNSHLRPEQDSGKVATGLQLRDNPLIRGCQRYNELMDLTQRRSQEEIDKSTYEAEWEAIVERNRFSKRSPRKILQFTHQRLCRKASSVKLPSQSQRNYYE